MLDIPPFWQKGLTVRELKRIVNREEATPAEIGLFVVYDMWESAHGRRAIVDNKLLRYIESKWQFKPYANELDYWIDLGQRMGRLELEAKTTSAEVQNRMLRGKAMILETINAIYSKGFLMLYEQASSHNLDVNVAAQAAAQKWPDSHEIKRVLRELKGYLEALYAYDEIMTDAGQLLGIQLTEALAVPDISTWIDEQELLLEQIEEATPDIPAMMGRPKILKELRELTHLDTDKTQSKVGSYWEEMLGIYLSPHWRDWARAGLILIEIAPGAERGLVDLYAGIAYVYDAIQSGEGANE